MWWQYVVTLIIALIAVWFSHWLSGKHEYRKAISSVKHEIAVNISICDEICKLIDTDLDAWKEDKMEITPYPPLHELAWSTWKSVILLEDSQLADEIEVAYFRIPAANNYLRRTEEFKWGLAAATHSLRVPQRDNLREAKHYIPEILLPRLKEAEELLEKASRQGKLAWLKKRF